MHRLIIAPFHVMLACVAAPLALAHSPVDPTTVREGHPTGHVGDHADLDWPPQPRGIESVQLLGDAQADARAHEATRRRLDAAERVALGRRAVVEALGARYRRIGELRDTRKGKPRAPARLVYFSHDRRATVEVLVEGAQARVVRSTPASEYQPEITAEETAEAIVLARQYWLANGRARAAQLQGFAILAYKPQGRGFYDTRVLYVSLHATPDAPPEYVAWVDLTRQRVLRAREERP